MTAYGEGPVGAILLAGGTGSRIGGAIPKQFILLHGKPIARYSFDLLMKLEAIEEVVVVCEPCYRLFFCCADKRVKFALPGASRQESVLSGVMALSSSTAFACVHDSARPFVEAAAVHDVIIAGKALGAAALGVPMKSTVKEIDADRFVVATPVRSRLWEVQTPQVVAAALLREGLLFCREHGIEVTDDVAVAELQGLPVKLVLGSYGNIKITTPEDLKFAINVRD